MSSPAASTHTEKSTTEFATQSTGPPAVAGASDPPGASSPELQLIYNTVPIGLAFLTPDCRYVVLNQRLSEICGVSIADHIGRSVRETVPQVAAQVESIVETILRTGEPVTGIEINGQRRDGTNSGRSWITYWHPLKDQNGGVCGINVVAEEITQRKLAEAALAASEARFRELADNMSQFAWMADATGSRTWFNKRWYEYTGMTFEDAQGWGWRSVYHPEHVDHVTAKVREGSTSGTAWEDIFPLRGVDGHYRWFLTKVVPISDPTADALRWFGTDTDVTRQIEAENALRHLNETLLERVETHVRERNRLWSVSQDLLTVADTDGRIISVNPAWTSMLGWSEAELLGKTAEWLVHPDDLERSNGELARLVEGSRTQSFENRLRHKLGSYRWLSWRAAPDRNLIFAVGRDVTELKDAEEKLRVSRHELTLVSRQTAGGVMAASIAHEVNQPLAAIVVNANAGLRWLKRTDPDLDEVRAVLERIVHEGHRTSEVIAGVRAMFGQGPHDGTAVNVNTVIREVLAMVQQELVSHQVIVQELLSDGLPPILAQRVQLQQVIHNLVVNAVDAMSAVDGRSRLLTVKTEICDLCDVMIAIEDTGSGIDPDHQNRVFEPFFTTKAKGMGIGLSVCRSIIESYGGRLWAVSRNPHGTTFHVQMPGATG